MMEDIILTEGMVLAVEPMINAGSSEDRTLKDGWTVVTRDGKCSAHFEHTLAITDKGCEILTTIQAIMAKKEAIKLIESCQKRYTDNITRKL